MGLGHRVNIKASLKTLSVLNKAAQIGSLAFVLTLLSGYLGAQSAQEPFGKNRIQYQPFNWQFLSGPNVDVYYYQGGESIARNAVKICEEEFLRITELFGFTPYTKARLYFYNNHNQLLQSNVGLANINSGLGGITLFGKSIVEIPFTGDWNEMRKSIAHGIAFLTVRDMLFGGSLKDMVQSAYLLTLPEWFMAGAARYAAEGWSRELDDFMRDASTHGIGRRPAAAQGQIAERIGQSIWTYMAERHGKASISNVLNLVRVMRNEETAILTSLGIPYDRFIQDWRSWYKQQAEQTATYTANPSKDSRLSFSVFKTITRRHVKVSKSGEYLAWTEAVDGKFKVLIKPTKGGRTKTVFSGGARLINQKADLNMPLIAWQSSDVIHVAYSHEGQTKVFSKNLKTGQKFNKQMYGLPHVLEMDVSADGRNYLFSGTKNGQSDLYIAFSGNGKARQVTNDLFDDRFPTFSDDRNIVFSSNRTVDTLGGKVLLNQIGAQYDLFELDAFSNNPTLRRITQTPFNEVQPQITSDSTGFYCLTDRSGIQALAFVPDSGEGENLVPFQISQFQQDLVDYSIEQGMRRLYTLQRFKGEEELFITTLPTIRDRVEPIPTPRLEELGLAYRKEPSAYQEKSELPTEYREPPKKDQRFIEAQKTDLEVQPAVPIDPKDLINPPIDYRNYVFEAEKRQFNLPVLKMPSNQMGPGVVLKPAEKKNPLSKLYSEPVVLGPFPYKNRFAMSEVATTLQIDPFNGLGGYLESNMTDMFENHKLTTGLLIFSDLRSSNLFGEYNYLKERVDFRARFTKRSIFVDEQVYIHRYNLNRLDLSAIYPLSSTWAVSATPFFMRSRFTFIDGLNTLTVLPINDQVVDYSGLRLEMTFDNSIVTGLNMIEGTRMRIRYEYSNGMRKQEQDFGQFLVDFRHYQKIYREFVLAIRSSYGTFFGPAAKDYLIGGMDNWLINRQSDITPNANDPLNPQPRDVVRGKTDYLFMQYVTNLRGFNYNAQYGNSYLLTNVELRLPITRVLYRGPVTNNFLRHLQFIAFYDVGTAWSGASPFGTDNNINTRRINSGKAFDISVTNFRNPFLQGYGLGMRTMFLGYYIRYDLARGIKDYQTQPAKHYITLGYDF